MTAVEEQRGEFAAAALRREFDLSFSTPARMGGDDDVDLLALRVGGDVYAARLADITGVLADSRLAPLPTAVPEFLGLIGRRGAMVPVWSLGALLGYGLDEGTPRWMILVRERLGGQTLALAFESCEGHLRVPRAELAEAPRADVPEAGPLLNVRHSVRVAGRWRGVLALESVAAEILRRLELSRMAPDLAPDDSHATTKKG